MTAHEHMLSGPAPNYMLSVLRLPREVIAMSRPRIL